MTARSRIVEGLAFEASTRHLSLATVAREVGARAAAGDLSPVERFCLGDPEAVTCECASLLAQLGVGA